MIVRGYHACQYEFRACIFLCWCALLVGGVVVGPPWWCARSSSAPLRPETPHPNARRENARRGENRTHRHQCTRTLARNGVGRDRRAHPAGCELSVPPRTAGAYCMRECMRGARSFMRGAHLLLLSSIRLYLACPSCVMCRSLRLDAAPPPLGLPPPAGAVDQQQGAHKPTCAHTCTADQRRQRGREARMQCAEGNERGGAEECAVGVCARVLSVR
jgi:hypothetical protein